MYLPARPPAKGGDPGPSPSLGFHPRRTGELPGPGDPSHGALPESARGGKILHERRGDPDRSDRIAAHGGLVGEHDARVAASDEIVQMA